MIIIGLAGGTGSGKTTVVKKILSQFPKNEVAVLHQDAYYFDQSELSLEERQKINFDHPSSIEFELLIKHLKQLKNNESIEEPIYSYISCTRGNETRKVEPRKVLIVEGILLFTDKKVRDLCDIKVFVDAEADDRLIRIIERDILERGRIVQQVIDRYGIVKQMHQQFIEPTKKFADLIVPQGGENKVAIKLLVDAIRTKLQDN
jgi:uridine kinase